MQPVVYPAVAQNRRLRLRFFITRNHTEEQFRATIPVLAGMGNCTTRQGDAVVSRRPAPASLNAHQSRCRTRAMDSTCWLSAMTSAAPRFTLARPWSELAGCVGNPGPSVGRLSVNRRSLCSKSERLPARSGRSPEPAQPAPDEGGAVVSADSACARKAAKHHSRHYA